MRFVAAEPTRRILPLAVAALAALGLASCAGSVIDTPDENPLPTSTPVTVELDPTPATESPDPPRVYVVQPGDTLGSVAANFGTDAQTLIALNGLTDPDALDVGDEILIPPTEGESNSDDGPTGP